MRARLRGWVSMRRILLAGDAALAVAALAAVAVFALVAIVHVDDNFHVDHVAGARLALVAYANEGTFYPPLVDDGFFAGTRYMPLGIALDAVAARIAGDALVAGKLVAIATMCALLWIVFLLARLGGGRAVALGAVGAVIATFTALFAATTIYGDTLPVALQLGAVAAIATGTSRRLTMIAGVLVALAFAAKFTAVWGALTVLLWLAVHDRRRLPAFAGAGLVTTLVVLGLAELASDGRFHDNVLSLSGAGSLRPGDLLDAPVKTWGLLRDRAPATAVLLPFAIAALVVALARRRLLIVELALLTAAAVTLVVMTDVGAGFNHLLDLVVLVSLVVAATCARAGGGAIRLILAAAVVLAIVASLVDVRGQAHEAAVQAARGETPLRLRAPALPAPLPEPFFTEDPLIAVQRGQRPVALDSYMLLRVLRERPRHRRALIARFERREFRSVVLFVDLDLRDPWWRESHLGIGVARAIDRNYRLARKVPGPVFAYRLLVPRRAATARGDPAARRQP